MNELNNAKQSGCARINQNYDDALRVGIVITLSDESQFSVATKEALHDYKIVLDGYKEGFFIIDRTGKTLDDISLIGEVVDQMSTWGIEAFNKKVKLQKQIMGCSTIDEILNIRW